MDLTDCVHPCMHYFDDHTQYYNGDCQRTLYCYLQEGGLLSTNVVLPTNNNDSGTLPSWKVLLITLVSIVTKQGLAYLSMAIETLSTPGALWSFIFSLTSLISVSVVCLHTWFSWVVLSESFIHSCHPISCFISISLISCSPLWENIADRCPEKIFTTSSILVQSVANLPCASFTAVSIPFFLTVLLTYLQNCLDVKYSYIYVFLVCVFLYMYS